MWNTFKQSIIPLLGFQTINCSFMENAIWCILFRYVFCFFADILVQNADLIPDVLRACWSCFRIPMRPGFIPVSKRLPGPFITSHNIYYVKSNMPDPACIHNRNHLNTCMLRDATIKMSTTFQQHFFKFSLSWSHPRKDTLCFIVMNYWDIITQNRINDIFLKTGCWNQSRMNHSWIILNRWWNHFIPLPYRGQKKMEGFWIA